MRRDIELIRELLLRLEAVEVDDPLTPQLVANDDLCPEGFTREQVSGHMLMLYDAGFIDHAEAAPSLYPGAWTFRDLSWSGHEFLDSVRNPETWAQTKATAKVAGGWTVGLLAEIAKAAIKAKAATYGFPL